MKAILARRLFVLGLAISHAIAQDENRPYFPKSVSSPDPSLAIQR